MNITISNNLASVEPSATLALTAKANELKAQGRDVCAFTAGEPDFDTPAHIRKAASDALTKGGKVCRYTPVAGLPEVKEAVAKKYKDDNGLSYAPNQIIISSGAKHVLFNALAAVVNPGDEVLYPAPYWVSYPEMVRAVGGKPVAIDGSKNPNFAPTGKQVKQAISPRTKAIFLNWPNNPTGAVIEHKQLEDIYGALEGTNVMVISDEIYEYHLYDGAKHVSGASLGPDAYARTVTVNSVSKSYAMTGWRIGYGAGPKHVIDAMSNYQSHATSNAATVSQLATVAALTGGTACVDDMRRAFNERRLLITQMLNDIPGVECVTPKGAFYAFPKVSALYGKGGVKNSTDFCAKLLEAEAVAIVPGAPFGADEYVRLSYAVSKDVIEKGVSRIAKFVKSLG
ncbi:MAG: pyridoxal phosphate-dependent aminotransferase [Planctomycetaceae bacterium]|nr:pyridoxal phosphate-dependent aminotransferase [Planctomycetaceae bacterium]